LLADPALVGTTSLRTSLSRVLAGTLRFLEVEGLKKQHLYL
jgi:hypothetical protein